ncbi:MAG: DJ-1/PfpI family protein [Candidatus Omnitrophica bacterium]|nr:DJ-1/PfpI family protein [Candidatus Omnitrophota bacterium]
MSKRILMVIAPEQFRDEEYTEPRKIFEQAGIVVTVVSSRSGKAVGKFGLEVEVDSLLKEVHATDFDAIVFIGGQGSRAYFNDPEAHRLVREAETGERIIGAICAAPGTLAKTGLLKGKRATSFSEESELLKQGGAIFTGKPVEVDGRIITGDGPQSAKAFGETIVNALRGSRLKT